MNSIWVKIVPIFLVIALVALGAAGYFFVQFQKTQEQLNILKSSPIGNEENNFEVTNQLVIEIGKSIELPNDEQPKVVTITSIDQLKDQSFFQKSKTGDKVLFYLRSKKAIIYDPVNKQVVNVAPISIGSQSSQLESGQIAGPKIVVRNGTMTNGLTNKLEPEIIRSLPNGKIISKENAAKNDFSTSKIVVFSEGSKTAAEKLSDDLAIPVGDLPEGENQPEGTDILIILGKDQI